MPSTKSMHQQVHNYLLRAKLSAAYENGDADSMRRIGAALDKQQLQKNRAFIARTARRKTAE